MSLDIEVGGVRKKSNKQKKQRWNKQKSPGARERKGRKYKGSK